MKLLPYIRSGNGGRAPYLPAKVMASFPSWRILYSYVYPFGSLLKLRVRNVRIVLIRINLEMSSLSIPTENLFFLRRKEEDNTFIYSLSSLAEVMSVENIFLDFWKGTNHANEATICCCLVIKNEYISS